MTGSRTTLPARPVPPPAAHEALSAPERLPEVDRLIEQMGDDPFLVPEVTPNDGKHRKTQVFHYLRDLCDSGELTHTNQGYVKLPPHDHTIEPGEINRRGCRRCHIEAGLV